MWKIERIMSVRRSTGGEVSALVRWAGNHSHTWEPLESFPGDELKTGVIGRRPKRRRLERLANAVLGYPPPRPDPRPARERVQLVRGQTEERSHFFRLVRGSDARVFKCGRKRWLISLGTSRRRVAEDGYGTGDDSESERGDERVEPVR